jgi:glycosyltransferase involved in cell wall biosynthesis
VELPVVSTTLSGIAEVVQDGRNGLLVPYADESALAEAIATLLDQPDERRRLGKNGRQTVVEHFELERNVEQLLQEFLA